MRCPIFVFSVKKKHNMTVVTKQMANAANIYLFLLPSGPYFKFYQDLPVLNSDATLWCICERCTWKCAWISSCLHATIEWFLRLLLEKLMTSSISNSDPALWGRHWSAQASMIRVNDNLKFDQVFQEAAVSLPIRRLFDWQWTHVLL